jgi:hypothetical protein
MNIKVKDTKFFLLTVGLSAVLYIDFSVLLIAAKITSLPLLLTLNTEPSNLIIIPLLVSSLYLAFCTYLSFFTNAQKKKM